MSRAKEREREGGGERNQMYYSHVANSIGTLVVVVVMQPLLLTIQPGREHAA